LFKNRVGNLSARVENTSKTCINGLNTKENKMPDRKRLHPETWTWAKDASFAQGVEVGDTVYIAGQASIDEDGKLVGDADDMQAQSRQTFKNIETVLTETGMSLDNVVNITCYITDGSKYADYTAVRSEVFTENVPASATVIVAGLVVPGLLVEVSAVAVR
jgi:enamine deaminase RidA (YjgF/YER057c/UK114 family)